MKSDIHDTLRLGWKGYLYRDNICTNEYDANKLGYLTKGLVARRYNVNFLLVCWDFTPASHEIGYNNNSSYEKREKKNPFGDASGLPLAKSPTHRFGSIEVSCGRTLYVKCKMNNYPVYHR